MFPGYPLRERERGLTLAAIARTGKRIRIKVAKNIGKERLEFAHSFWDYRQRDRQTHEGIFQQHKV